MTQLQRSCALYGGRQAASSLFVGLFFHVFGTCSALVVAPATITWPAAASAAPGPAPAPFGASPAPGPAAAALGPVNYLQHGADWQQDTCGSRHRQSPISLDVNLEEPPRQFFDFNYLPITVPIQLVAANGTLSADLSAIDVGGAVYRQVPYRLVRLDIHGPAEHLMRGERSPLEIQLVHRQANVPSGGNYMIVSVLVWCEHPPMPPPPNAPPAPEFAVPTEGEADFNDLLQHFVGAEPPKAEGASVDLATITPEIPLDLARLMESQEVPPDQRGRFVFYPGSLTAPPCEERVSWFVRRSTVNAGDSQVKALADAIYALTGNAGNNRAVMPLNQRQLSVTGAKYDPTLVIPGGPNGGSTHDWERKFLPMGPNPRTDGELRAFRFAKAANAKVKEVVDYTSKFVDKMRTAHQDYAYEMGTGSSANDPGVLLATTATTTQGVDQLRVAMRGVAGKINSEATKQALETMMSSLSVPAPVVR